MYMLVIHPVPMTLVLAAQQAQLAVLAAQQIRGLHVGCRAGTLNRQGTYI